VRLVARLIAADRYVKLSLKSLSALNTSIHL
jgi:hypothetical protein